MPSFRVAHPYNGKCFRKHYQNNHQPIMGKKHEISADLAIRREFSGMSNRDIAHLLETSSKRISRIENGHSTPNTEELYRLSVIYDAPIAELLPSLSYKANDRLKELLAEIPSEPSNWNAKHERRLETLNSLFLQLQALDKNSSQGV